MKTLRICIVLCFFAAFAVNNVNAQNKVYKTEFPLSLGCQKLPCIDDYLDGEVVVELMLMKDNMVARIKKATVSGYIDDLCEIPSSNVYEISQTLTGIEGSKNTQNTALCYLNGKLMFELHFVFYSTTDENGNLIVKLDKTMVNCKN